MLPFSKDQVDVQIKIFVAALGTIMSAVGITNYERIGEIIGALLAMVGPVAYVYVAVSLYYRMSRPQIIAAAAAPVAPGVAAPIIILPKEEKAIADQLPGNVTAHTGDTDGLETTAGRGGSVTS